MKIRIYENLRTVSYAPFYLAGPLGHFAGEGLDVEVVPSPRPAETAAGLIEGRVDVSWGGPMRVLLHHDADPDCPLVCFCQVVGRDPFVLVGREPRPGFRFTDLADLTLGVASEVPTPWMLLQDDLDRAGIDPDTIRRGPPRTMPENARALRDGRLDVVQVMEPHAQPLLADGAGHLWHRFSVRGDLAFTTFYSRRDFVDAHPDTCAALTRALVRSVAALYAMESTEAAGLVAPLFPDTPPALLAGAIAGYQAARLWTTDPSITPAHLARLKAALLSGGLISRDIPYDTVVTDRFAKEAP